MKFRSTVVYFLVALVLTGFYLFDSARRSEKKVVEEKAARIFEFQADQLQSIVFAKEKEQIKIEKSVHPPSSPAASPLF